jgi:hypothetical protein
MKYIKSFNESKNISLDSIRDLCESRLVYLLDEGFKIDVSYQHAWYVGAGRSAKRHENVIVVTFNKPNGEEEYVYDHYYHLDQFEWEDIKDSFIPLLKDIKNNYKLAYTELGKEIHLKGELSIVSSIGSQYLASIDTAIEKEWLPAYSIKEIQFLITSFVK